MNKFSIAGALITLGVVGLAMWVYWPAPGAPVVAVPTVPVPETTPIATSTQTVIGSSVESRPIEVFTFGTGEIDLLFVGGVHGGYEANSVRLADE